MIDIMSLIFRFVDFFVVAIFIAFIIHRYVLPAAEKMLRDQRLFIYNLESDCNDLRLQSQAIHETIQDQDRQFKALQANFKIWQEECKNRVIQEKNNQQKIDAAMHTNFESKVKFMHHEMMIKKQLPSILDEAACDLSAKYRLQDMQKQYIDTLINLMKEVS